MKLKRIVFLLIFVIMIGLIVACNKQQGTTTEHTTNPDLTDPLYDEEIVVSYIHTDINTGKTYIMVDDKPFLFIGAEIRVDALINTDKYSYDFIETLFAKAHELGVTVVQIPVEWKDIELEDNVWDFTFLDKMLTFANKYDLKMEFLWFGTNMCGDTHSYTVPDYILRDGKTYPKLDAIRTGEFWNYYGIMWYLDFNNHNLMEKEARAAKMMMDYVWEWDRTHGAKHPVIGVQILNEADIFVRWRIDQYQVQSKSGGKMSYEEGWQKIMDSLDYIGKAVKSAKYKVYTRTNFANSTGADNLSNGHGIYEGNNVKLPPTWAMQIFNLDGIDIVGDDSYKSNVSEIKGISYMYGKNLQGNFSHIAENDGSYRNTPSLILTAVSQGAGYVIYDLFTSPFFVRNGTSGVEQGIVKLDNEGNLVNKEHFAPTKVLISGLKKAWSEVVLTTPENFGAFNVVRNYPDSTITQEIRTNSVIINFTTNTSALAFALEREGYLTVFATDKAYMSFGNIEIDTVEKGYYESDGIWISLGSVNITNQTLELIDQNVYRIKFKSVNEQLTSTTWDNIGS